MCLSRKHHTTLSSSLSSIFFIQSIFSQSIVGTRTHISTLNGGTCTCMLPRSIPYELYTSYSVTPMQQLRIMLIVYFFFLKPLSLSLTYHIITFDRSNPCALIQPSTLIHLIYAYWIKWTLLRSVVFRPFLPHRNYFAPEPKSQSRN